MVSILPFPVQSRKCTIRWLSDELLRLELQDTVDFVFRLRPAEDDRKERPLPVIDLTVVQYPREATLEGFMIERYARPVNVGRRLRHRNIVRFSALVF